MRIGSYLLNLLFPPRCPCCGNLLDEPDICAACRKAMPWIADTEREETAPGGVRCAALAWYEGPAREAVLRLKFHGVSSSAEVLGRLMAACAAECFSGDFDTVTWVPVSRRRLRKRGYDQSRLLAESMCRVWGVRPQRLLTKERDNPPQSGLTDAAARRANVLGVYRAEERAAAGRRILLVDDVMTTGATLGECTRELALAGARDVLWLTLTRVRKRPAGKSGD